MKKTLTTFLSLMLVFAAQDVFAGNSDSPDRKDNPAAAAYSQMVIEKFPGDVIKYGPWVTDVTDTGFNVIWVTNDKSLSWVEVTENDGSNFYVTEHKRHYQTVSGRRMSGTFHSIRIDGLKPGTSYMYKIAGQIVSNETNPYRICYEGSYAVPKVFTVSTLDSKAETCTFSQINDMHFDDAKYSALIQGLTSTNRDFMLLNGDIVSYAEKVDTLIKHSFEPIKDIAPYIPTVFARGNHEGRGPEWYKAGEVFPTSTGEFYYTFRQGPVAFVVLDAGEDKPDSDVEYSGTAQYDEYRANELAWLKEAVKDKAFADAPVKICLIHIPTILSKDCWYCEKWICDNFIPVLNEAGIDLMLSGHHHKYIHCKKGEGPNNYPIIANSHLERLDVFAKVKDGKKSLVVNTVDVNGKITRTITIL